MALGGALKQIIWLLFICTADVPIYLSAAIGGLNTAADTANTVLFLWASRSQNNVSFYFGIVLYIIGIYLELASELQRRAFKTQPRAANRGKVHTTGLFDLARHINYAGFALWRAGYAMAAAGIPWGVAVGGFFLWDFASRAVPSLEGYMREEVSAHIKLGRLCRRGSANGWDSTEMSGRRWRGGLGGGWCRGCIEGAVGLRRGEHRLVHCMKAECGRRLS